MTDKLDGVRGKWQKILEHHGVFDREDELLNTPIPIEGGCQEGEGTGLIGGSGINDRCDDCKGTGKLDKTITAREAIERVIG